MSNSGAHIIVGAGLAGAKAAESLRHEGLEGRIILLGAEGELPYERPPLSKEYLRGESPREQARVHPDGFYESHEIELRTSAEVRSIDTTAQEVVLADGERLSWARLLLATGAEPRRLDVAGAELDGVHYLRDFADADRLAAVLQSGGRCVVIGAGWIGAEVAASARQKGLEVEIVERARVPLEHVLGPEVGNIYAGIHRSQGVVLHTDAALEAIEGDGRVERVRLGDGRAIDCQAVVVGIGVMPRVALAEAAGIGVENGVTTNESLETDIPGVFAAGDIANAFHPFYGHRLRVEHWANAIRHGEIAGRTMLGKPAEDERLPYFFSDQYDVGMEYSGFATEWEEVVFRGDPSEREFIAFWLKNGRVIAGMNVNIWDVADQIADLIRSERAVPLEALRDPDVALSDLTEPGQ